MELFQKLIIIGFLFLLFVIFPLCIGLYQNQQNKKRITKINFKPTIIYYYIYSILISLVIGIIYLKINTTNQSDLHTINPTKIETHEEWFETKYKSEWQGSKLINIGNQKHYIYEDNKPFQNNEGKWMMNGVADEGEWMIKRKYTFYGLNGLGKGQHPEYEPTDLAPYVKNPFNNWYNFSLTPSSSGGGFNYFIPKNKDKDSQFVSDLRVSFVNCTVGVDYQGPKYLLEEDKDFFMDEILYPTNKKNEDGHTILNVGHLHFNPFKQYITLYTKKFNNKTSEEKPKLRTRGI